MPPCENSVKNKFWAIFAKRSLEEMKIGEKGNKWRHCMTCGQIGDWYGSGKTQAQKGASEGLYKPPRGSKKVICTPRE